MTTTNTEDEIPGGWGCIPFIQYLRPNGRRVTISISRPLELAQLAARIIEKGYVFEIEYLGEGLPLDVSMTIHSLNLDKDVAIELCKNGPDIPHYVDKMIKEFAQNFKID